MKNMVENKILMDIEINKRCLKEETSSIVRKLLELWLKYDYELLALVRDDDVIDWDNFEKEAKNLDYIESMVKYAEMYLESKGE